MKRTIIIISLVAAIAMAATGKTIRRQLTILETKVPETETIAPETMEFVYDYSWCNDTTGRLDDNYTTDRMLLQIGPDGLSKFSSYKNLTVDSILMRSSNDQVIELASSGKLTRGESVTVFKNYPAGRLTNTEKICKDWFRYEEEMPAIEWELTDSVATVLGFECQSAKCTFRGREWTVFFAEEIPVMDGPWKFSGLPGLVMKAEDADGHYKFECVGIKSKADWPITIYKVPYHKTDCKGYYDAKNRYDVNPYAYFQTTTGGNVTVTDEAGNPVLDALDPIPLLYDYIERDWTK